MKHCTERKQQKKKHHNNFEEPVLNYKNDS